MTFSYCLLGQRKYLNFSTCEAAPAFKWLHICLWHVLCKNCHRHLDLKEVQGDEAQALGWRRGVQNWKLLGLLSVRLFFFFMRLPTNPVCPIYPFTATAQYILIRNRLQVLLKLAQTQVKCCHFLDCFIPSMCSLIDTNMCAFVVQFSEGEAEGKTAICSILYFMNRQS